MNSMTSPGPMANSVCVVVPHNSYPVMPGAVPQVPLYSNNQPQIHLVPGNPPGLMPTVNELPAIQILISLIHLGLGSITLMVLSESYIPVSLYRGFPFWGGIWFIISESLSVAAENQPNSSCVLNGSVDLNTFRAICSAVGVILFITDLSLIRIYSDPGYYPNQSSRSMVSVLLHQKSLLWLRPAVSQSHMHLLCAFVFQMGVVIPNVYAENPPVFPEPPNPLPRYSSVVQGSR
uniref:Membrane-spanning 4-domains, subfamily A, member 8A n=1 Tax=Nannospalax galili TaxID=1026970 RepID=A0A8C6QQ45_NANGA